MKSSSKTPGESSPVVVIVPEPKISVMLSSSGPAIAAELFPVVERSPVNISDREEVPPCAEIAEESFPLVEILAPSKRVVSKKLPPPIVMPAEFVPDVVIELWPVKRAEIPLPSAELMPAALSPVVVMVAESNRSTTNVFPLESVPTIPPEPSPLVLTFPLSWTSKICSDKSS